MPFTVSGVFTNTKAESVINAHPLPSPPAAGGQRHVSAARSLVGLVSKTSVVLGVGGLSEKGLLGTSARRKRP